MNTSMKVLIGLVAAVVVASLVATAFFLGAALSPKGNLLGAVNATTTYNSALNQNSLYLWEIGVAGDLSSLRAPLAGVNVSTTASLGFGALATSTGGTATSVLLAIPGTIGDIVFVTSNTSTPYAQFTGHVTVSSSTSATFEIDAQGVSSTVVTPAAGTYTVWDLPKASFTAPASLNISTTSAPYNP